MRYWLKFSLGGAFLFVPGFALAQLTITNLATVSTAFNGSYSSINTAGYEFSQVGESVVLTASGHETFIPDRTTTFATGSVLGRFSATVGEFPVQLGAALHHNGKAVLAGAGSDDSLQVVLQWNVYEVDDANDNGVFDPGETTFLMAGSADPSAANIAGSGFEIYDFVGNPATIHNLILGADGTYLFQVQDFMFFTYAVGAFDPNIRGTNELDSQFSGSVLSFNATVIPEPASLLALGLGVVPFLRTRRRRSQQ